MKTFKSNISEAYKVQVDCLKHSEPDSFDKNEIKEKVNDLVRLHEAMQEKFKTASYSEQIKLLLWYLNALFRIFNVFEYHFWTSHEIKNVGEILAKPAPKKGKTLTAETLHLVTNTSEDENFSR